MSSTPLSSRPPPPRMPSPQPMHTPLPPPLPRRVSSRTRLHLPMHPEEPPIPPRLIGSPLLQRFTATSQSQPQYMTEKAQSELWLDGDEFGTKRKENAHLQVIAPPSPLLAPTTPKRSPRRRSRSPPPTPRLSTPPPPVPPVPSSALTTPGAKKAVIHTPPPRKASAGTIPELTLDPPRSPDKLRYPHSTGGVTCFEYITLHSTSRGVAT